MWNIGCERCSSEYETKIAELEKQNQQLVEFISRFWTKNEEMKSDFSEIEKLLKEHTA